MLTCVLKPAIHHPVMSTKEFIQPIVVYMVWLDNKFNSAN